MFSLIFLTKTLKNPKITKYENEIILPHFSNLFYKTNEINYFHFVFYHCILPSKTLLRRITQSNQYNTQNFEQNELKKHK